MLCNPNVGDVIDTLNIYLRNELSAVETYALASNNIASLGLPSLLDDCKRSHQQRAEILRAHIIELGGEPSTAPGTWGLIPKAVQNELAHIREKVGIAALEEFEYHDLKRYREELAKLDDAARLLMQTHVLPAQEHTYRTIKAIRNTLG
jgi:bacterioferritin (cytochrome b1)